MIKGLHRYLLAFWCLLVPVKAQTQIQWFSESNATNFSSNGTTAMDASYRFELGVFTGAFVPAPENISDWSANWNAVQRTSYQTGSQRFASEVTAETVTAPFTAGKKVYVWGFKGDPAAGEWILFGASTWLWPDEVFGPPPLPETWNAKDATTVIGTIHSTGSPFLIQAAAVADALPPVTTFAQWQADELSGETLIEAHQDADGDGTANILEFIFGTSPKIANPSPLASASLLSLSNERYLQLIIPRRADRPANLVVEVSENLSQWNSGSGHTATVLSSNTSLTVRDLTPISPTAPKRFIRINATP